MREIKVDSDLAQEVSSGSLSEEGAGIAQLFRDVEAVRKLVQDAAGSKKNSGLTVVAKDSGSEL